MTTRISVEEILQLARKALRKHGISASEANVIVEHLLDGELSGRTAHGFLMISDIIKAAEQVKTPRDIKVQIDTPSSCLLDGNNHQGIVVALQGTCTAIEKAKRNEIAVVGGRNYVGPTGAIGYYGRKIADAGLIGIMTASSEEAVAPWGGSEKMLGTNPLCISIPTLVDPIVVDFATSNWSYGDIFLAMLNGKSIPEGVILDSSGNPSTNPRDVVDGSQLPFGAHKGYALDLALEILAGPFVGAMAGVKRGSGTHGFTIMVLAPDLFVPKDNFVKHTSALVNEVKNSRKRPGVKEIYYPGEKSHRRRIHNRHVEYIELSDQIFENMNMLAQK